MPRGLNVLLAVLLFTVAGAASAKVVKEGSRSGGQDPDRVFDAIAQAWQDADAGDLAKLVHEDGLRVTSGDYDRFTSYSPSQAFYYFRNQFQMHPTVSFEFSRLQQKQNDSGRIHGMVVWKYRRPSVKEVQEVRLVLVLTQQGRLWRLAEINTITAR